MKYIIGFDTSCYTTSMAAVDLKGRIIFNHQKILEVSHGEKGLQQSSALFQHLQNLPIITSSLKNSLPNGHISAVCASISPRPLKDSYMPVFLFSHKIGLAISDLLRIPFYSISHQENHIMAGIHTANGPRSRCFMALHLSGGTSELLLVKSLASGYKIEIIGNSTDIPAGQFVDRIGVAMGLPFPAGPSLEELAMHGTGTITLNGSVKGTEISFSGPESHGQRLIRNKASQSEIAYAVYDLLIRVISKWILNAVRLGYPEEILLVGGVTSSNFLRKGLQERLQKRNRNIQLYFADPELSKDNAVGAALLGLQFFKSDYMKMEEQKCQS